MPFRLPRLLAPAWFDEARFIVQGEQFEAALAAHPLSGRVLNAGCGEGLYVPLLERRAQVASIWNIDVHPPSIARRRADRRHRDVQGSLTALPFRRGAFDAVLCSEVLEHIEADRVAVRELARVLAPGGVLLLSVPAIPAPYDPAHVREGYTPDALTALLRSEGFRIQAMRDCHHAFMRLLYRVWHWQLGAARRNLFPRGLLRPLAHLDRMTRWGRPWDLLVVAVCDLSGTETPAPPSLSP